MKNKLKSKSSKALYIKKWAKRAEGWNILSEKQNEVTLEKTENFTHEETRNYVIRGMRDAKSIERKKVIIASIILFAIFLSSIIFALNS